MAIRRKVPAQETVVARPAAGPRVAAAPADPLATAPPPVAGPPADPFLVPPVDTMVAPPVPPEGYMPPGEVADNRFGMGMLIALLILLAIGGVVAAFLLTRHHNKHPVAVTQTVITKVVPAKSSASSTPAQIVVPNLIGMAQPDAVKSLQNERLKVRVVTVRGPSPAGVILGETPGPQQKVAPGSIVTLRISNGLATPKQTPAAPKPTTTAAPPAHKTTPPSQATHPASPAPAASTPTTTAQQTTPPSTQTSPSQSTQSTTTQSSSTPAAPPKPANASVPDVSGQQVQGAAAAIAKAGFLVTIAYVPNDDPLGTVEAMSPAAGTTAPTTAHITINASSGPGQKQQETVPDATGMSIPQAVAAMQHAGLRLIFLKKPVVERADAGKVVEQSPEAGKTAPHNAQILVYMGAYQKSNH